MADVVSLQAELNAKDGAPLSEVKNASAQPNTADVTPNGHVVHASTNNSAFANKILPIRADCYWFAQSGETQPSHVNNAIKTMETTNETDDAGRTGSTTAGLVESTGSQLDRDDRIRLLRERQTEDRHRRLEELRSAAVNAQKFRETQEEDRRRKIEEIRWRDTERRHLVEERKRQIWEAERERRDTILRKGQEREVRIEAKRNAQRNSIGFAFGSCTPRMLDLDMSAASGSPSAMAGRRSNSQSNVLAALSGGTAMTLSRDESLDTVDGDPQQSRGSNLDHRRRNSVKHRHTIHEAFFWENYASDSHPSHHTPILNSSPKVQSVSVNPPWADHLSKTTSTPFPNSNSFLAGNRLPESTLYGTAVQIGGDDLMTQSLTSLASTTPFRRGRRRTDLVPTIPTTSIHRDPPTMVARTRSPAPSSPSRPLSSMSQQSLSSQNSSVSLRTRNTQSVPRRPRPLSVAGSQPDSRQTADERRGRSVEKRMPSVNSTPNPKPPPRAKSVGAGQLMTDGQSAILKAVPIPAKRRPPPPPKRQAEKPKIAPKPTLRKPVDSESPAVLTDTVPAVPPANQNSFDEQTPPVPAESSSNGSESPSEVDDVPAVPSDTTFVPKVHEVSEAPSNDVADAVVREDVKSADITTESSANVDEQHPKEVEAIRNDLQQTVLEYDPLIGAPVAKPRITTEEEAKAAMAEKRRLAREQAEREAELERQRQEQLRLEEEERLRREEEEQREWELEQERSRMNEQERLRRAIEEQQQREEEERLRREEEFRQKEEKEKAERIAREEQENARKENEKKLRREEEERAQRRRRVEMIMSRTRAGKASGTTTPPSMSSKNDMDSTSGLFSQEQEQQMMDVAIAGTDDDDDVHIHEQNGISSQDTSPIEEEIDGDKNGVRTNGFTSTDQSDSNLMKKSSALIGGANDDIVNQSEPPTIDPHSTPSQVHEHQLIDLTVVGGRDNATMLVVSTGTRGPKSGEVVHHHHHHLRNEDSVNFNITRNGIDDSSFVIDNYANNARQESTVTDLLS